MAKANTLILLDVSSHAKMAPDTEADALRIPAAFEPAVSQQRSTGTPRPRTRLLSRQVSWLAGHRLHPAFPESHDPSDA